MTTTEIHELLDTVAKVLLRCFVLGFLLLLLWFFAYLAGGDVIYHQGTWFDLTPHEINVIHYCGMGLVKGCMLLFFLFPYLAIRLVLRNRPT
ncbi:MAG: hypothetical protein HUU20_05120 [Pirellulales bacterium]|nr:hypothetical protein [Pirellulales bacterium]